MAIQATAENNPITSNSLPHLLSGGISTGYVHSQGTWELELKGSYLDVQDASLYEAVFEVEHGLRDWLTVEVEMPVRRAESGNRYETGLGDLELELKAILYRGDAMSIAMLAEVELPTGDEEKGLGSGEWELETYLNATWQLMPDWALHVQAGAEWEEGRNYEEAVLKTALDWRATPVSRLQFAMEAVWPEGGSAREISAGLGAKHELRAPTQVQELEIGIGLFAGLSNAAPDWGIRVVLECEL